MSQTMNIRRVLTGHDGDGSAVVWKDGPPTQVRESRPGALGAIIWTTSGYPADNSSSDDFSERRVATADPNGTVFRVIDFTPGVARRMHRTETVDYIVVMSGEIDMELDNGREVHLRAGDVMVQRGTIHNWINRGKEVCRIAVVLVAAQPVRVGDKVLTAIEAP